jgi:hypothetical protein
MQDEVLMEYVRDRKKNKVGMLIGQMGKDGMVEIGWSRCHKDDTFTREEGMANAAVNVGFAIPHSFAQAAKAFRVSCFLRFNSQVEIPKVMTHGLQPRQSKPGTQKNSGHRIGCACRIHPDFGGMDCTCRELALKARGWDKEIESLSVSLSANHQMIGRLSRG